MIIGAKVVINLETKEYFTYNLVIWRIFVWLFGIFLFGHLTHFRLVICLCVLSFARNYYHQT